MSPNTNVTDGVDGNRIIADWKTIVENDGVKALVKLNGGTTPTILPLANGPAVDKGNPEYRATGVDQRGLPWAVKKLGLWSIYSCATFHPEGISDSSRWLSGATPLEEVSYRTYRS